MFLPLKETFGGKTCGRTPRKYLSKLGMKIQNLSERLDFFYCDLSFLL